MSPVIYRPSGSGPDRDPYEPTRVPFAGPGIPTAASFADDEVDVAPLPQAPPTQMYTTEALEESSSEEDPGRARERSRTSTRRPVKQRRRRRILGRQDDREAAQPEAAEPQPSAPEPPAPGAAVPRPRRRRVRSVTMSAPPIGPGDAPDAAQDSAPSPPIDEELAPIAEVTEDQHRAVADDEIPGATDLAAEEITANAVAADDATPDPASRPDSDPETDDDPAQIVAIGGRVRSTRQRGLRGMTVTVIDESDEVVAETLTGRRGEFVIEDLPAGTYRVGARDAVDGDFSDGWHGSVDAARATMLQVDELASLPSIDVTLAARVGINADLSLASDRAAIDIVVIDRTTGLPAMGEVIVSTEHFRTTLPLTDGRTSITVFGSAPGASHSGPELAPRLRIQYTGAEHSAPATRTVRLR